MFYFFADPKQNDTSNNNKWDGDAQGLERGDELEVDLTPDCVFRVSVTIAI